MPDGIGAFSFLLDANTEYAPIALIIGSTASRSIQCKVQDGKTRVTPV